MLPAAEKIGVGWFSTISAGFLVVSSLATGAAVLWGNGWRDGIDEKRRARRKAGEERVEEGDLEKGVVDVVGGGKGKESL